ncbi:hypothetical protein CRP01_03055 [Flavilitoribacter nigricans DSM 23189 = NBRC 102662]|uniref:Uncharacterized protein n=1 Tax=Flavilitoribacter nigricans (strain ATCC 23147 / DSM 23189 / NBRC 102662 / NCIMB 1420 / SS-2) TaxID=1122177 RepID=A0A2D0NIX7_FLAN2|nr:hypothetical protein CRP01_03055 [Flavilitoribacter nigricans DSM 23189 = NBRC 102662]
MFFCGDITAQVTSNDLVRDTIIYRTNFLNRTYLLDGKPLTLPVMAFFMKDYPLPNNEIKLAQLTDQLCIAGYSIGSLFTIGGLLVSRQNKDLGGDLLQLGLVGVGSGLIFQIISGSFKLSAVRHYNEEVKKYYQQKTSAIRFRASADGAGIVWFIR